MSHGFGFGSNGPSVELNALVNNLLENAPARAESWSAASLYWESRGDARRCVRRAIVRHRRSTRHRARHQGVPEPQVQARGPRCTRSKGASTGADDANVRRARRGVPHPGTRQGGGDGQGVRSRLKRAASTRFSGRGGVLRQARRLERRRRRRGRARRRSHRDGARRCYEQSLKLDPSCAGVVAALPRHASSGRSKPRRSCCDVTWTRTAHARGRRWRCTAGSAGARAVEAARGRVGALPERSGVYPESDEAGEGSVGWSGS